MLYWAPNFPMGTLENSNSPNDTGTWSALLPIQIPFLNSRQKLRHNVMPLYFFGDVVYFIMVSQLRLSNNNKPLG